MNKAQKAIIGLECCALLDVKKRNGCRDCIYNQEKNCTGIPKRGRQVALDAVEELKKLIPHVMTWNEVLQSISECRPVYIEKADDADKVKPDDRWGMLAPAETVYNGVVNDLHEKRAFHVFSSLIQDELVFRFEYDDTWRAWTVEPSDEDKKGSPWGHYKMG